jgi:ADP-heptose:LPS heptosyltransferase
MQSKIVIFRALKLGDMLCFIPTLKAIRATFPYSEITLICHKSLIPFLERYRELIDVIEPFPGFPGMPEQDFNVKNVTAFISRMQNQNFENAFQLHGSGEISNLLVSLFGAKITYGFYREGFYCPNEESYKFYPENLSEIDRCLSMMDLIGPSDFDKDLEFPLFPSDFQELSNHMGLLTRPYYCIHPGASTESKRWSKKGFAYVADYLREKGFEIIFTGSKFERELVTDIQGMMRGHSIDSASWDLPLGPLSALIHESQGVICNDTGVSHLASALKKPSIVLFSETDPNRWAPLNMNLHHSLYRPSLEELIYEINTFFFGPDFQLKNMELT